MVVCEVPEARVSVNDETSFLIEVYFNIKHDCTVYKQSKLDRINWSSLRQIVCPVRVG